MKSNLGPKFLVSIFGLLIVLLMMTPGNGFAQIDRGSIVGAVSDPSGAAIPNATVTVANKSTGINLTAKTNSSGRYQVLSLLPGTYTVKAAAAGFQTAVREGLVIHVQSREAVNFSLTVGAVKQEVVVTGREPLLQTETADMGSVVGTQRINDLPLNGRRYSDLALLEPGVQKYYSANNPAPDRFSVNGNMELQNDFLLNGIDNNSWSENLQEFSVQVVQPPPDALQEFRVQTRTYSSEFGNSAGAVINAMLKSGTNQFHGDLFEFVRNDKLDANDWINNHTNVDKGHFVQNQYGGTLGGPIVRNKLFFFGDFQRFSQRRATTIQSTVPTPLMKQGDFTELQSTLTDPPVPGQQGCIVGNVIQGTSTTGQTCIDPVGASLTQLFPDPNIPAAVALQGIPASWTGASNYVYSSAVPDDVYSFDTRIDYALNDKNHIFGSYSYNHQAREDPPWTSNAAVGNGNFATAYRIHSQHVTLGWTDTLSNSVFNDARAGFSRDYAHSDPVGVELGKSLAPQYGLQGIPETPNTAGLPPIEISGLTRMGTSPWRPQYQISQSWNFLDNLSWLKGNHSFKFGYQYLRRTDNFLDIRAPQGEIQPSGAFTSNSQMGLSDFLLGDISGAHFTTPLVVHYFQPGHSFYGQDSWQITPKLTINYGLRYELFGPIMDRQNRTANFTAANGGGLVTAMPDATGWYQRALIHPDKNDFAPRLGFAYHMMNRLVWRGGYGVFYQHYSRIGSESLIQLNQPFLNDVQVNDSTTPIFQLQNGFPASITQITPALPGVQVRAQDPNQRSGYVEQASFGPEIEISNNSVLSLSYIGNWARKMNRLRNYNQGVVTGFDAAGCPTMSFPYSNLNTVSSVDTLVTASPLKCALGGQHAFLEYATNDGISNYNALDVSYRRSFSKGISYAVNYTWSHGLADYGTNLTGGAFPQNAYNYGNQYSNSILDVAHRFVSNFIWELPFGTGHRFLSGGGAANQVLGGWQFNGIVTLQTGSPFSIGTSSSNNPNGQQSGVSLLANCIGDPFVGTTDKASSYTTTGRFISASGFSTPGPGRFGSCPPLAFHGPGIEDVDLSLFKEFHFKERYRLQFRGEFFNAFNHPNFANPNANIANPGSFGLVTSTLAPILGAGSGGPGDPREIQLALKLYF